MFDSEFSGFVVAFVFLFFILCTLCIFTGWSNNKIYNQCKDNYNQANLNIYTISDPRKSPPVSSISTPVMTMPSNHPDYIYNSNTISRATLDGYENWEDWINENYGIGQNLVRQAEED